MYATKQLWSYSFVRTASGQNVFTVGVESQAVDLCIVRFMLLHHTCTDKHAPLQLSLLATLNSPGLAFKDCPVSGYDAGLMCEVQTDADGCKH